MRELFALMRARSTYPQTEMKKNHQCHTTNNLLYVVFGGTTYSSAPILALQKNSSDIYLFPLLRGPPSISTSPCLLCANGNISAAVTSRKKSIHLKKYWNIAPPQFTIFRATATHLGILRTDTYTPVFNSPTRTEGRGGQI